jgi:hypothetical protein
MIWLIATANAIAYTRPRNRRIMKRVIQYEEVFGTGYSVLGRSGVIAVAFAICTITSI